ncbi:GNAT family N-acetyltransferase [Alloscardovia macacae]|uniref:GNAT family acetyltransferase n=1 Tax=Alloscardovia macacae TaxID=1160091 RepID=A0A261F6J2_9BIFI|nr:GNAT family N-acetyltransferase [Alloscardovia macacae]OZG54653.1 GNAT family acetyltransferase [Alloscardovia macacae]
MELRVPGPSDARAVEEMVAEFVAEESPYDGMFADLMPFRYDAWLAENERDLHAPKPGFVPAVQYVSFDESTGSGIGFLSVRLVLNEYLLNVGGHIGYCIRPGMRGHGYGRQQLRLRLERAREQGLDRVLITCSVDNAASRQIILGCGGVLEDVREMHERYWISV